MKSVQQESSKHVGPSRYMEFGLTGLVGTLLGVSIIGIAYVYGFTLNGNLLDNLSAAVRAVGVDGGFFLGLYFSRRHWTREKAGWGDGLMAILAGIPWFLVAMMMAGVSWLSNTLFVNGSTTIITQAALDKAGITFLNAQQANWMIGGIPLLVILLYSLVPSQSQVRTDTRTPEEIEQEARQEAARIRAQIMVAAARAEGAGARLRTVVGGLVGEALNLEERNKRDERRKQMRIALETAGHATADLNDEQVEIQAAARGVWDQKRDEAIKAKPAVRPTATSQALVEVAPLEGGEPAAPAGSPETETLSIHDLAELLDVSRGTISNWLRPDAPEATRIGPEEVTTLPDGSRRIHPSVLPRLKRAQAAKKPVAPARTTRTSQGRLPAVAATALTHGNGKRQTATRPLDLPKLDSTDEQNR